MKSSGQVVETPVNFTNSSPFGSPHPDDHSTRLTLPPGFKQFSVYFIYLGVVLMVSIITLASAIPDTREEIVNTILTIVRHHPVLTVNIITC